MNRRSILLPVALLAAGVAASPASAAGNGWSCISPFANYTNSTYPDDPPAPNHIVDWLGIKVERTDSTALTAVAGQKLPLRDLRLTVSFGDPRVAEQMYRRTGGATSSYSSLIPWQQVENTLRTLSIRANPGDGNANYWAYNTGTNQTPNWVYADKIDVPGTPPKVRDAGTEPGTTWYYASPTLGLAHRYLWHTGNTQFPLDAWVTVSASNTVEGTQTLHVPGYWTINIQDATPGTPGNPANYNNDEVTATVPDVVLDLPRVDWTPTGAGPVEFTIAPQGNMGIIQVESKGYERPGYNTPLNVRPYGSVYVRAQTDAYGASNDCIPGTISLADSSITAGQPGLLFGDASPDAANTDPAVGDPATPGFFTNQNGLQPAVGTRGRFAFAFAPQPALAVAALPAPAPTPVPTPTPTAPKGVTFASASSAKLSKTGSVKLSLTNPNSATTRYKVAVKSASKYKVGKSRKTVTVATTRTVSLKPGASSLSVKVSKTARTLLKARKSIKVKVTVTPASGGTAVTKTLTIRA